MRRCLVILAATLVPGALFAQEAAQSWPGLKPSALSTVYVRDDTGRETEGRLLRLDPDALVLLVDGAERRFDAAHVRRIQKRGDSLKNGAIIGAIVGVGLGAISAGVSDCPGEDPGGTCAGFRALAFLASTGIYAAIGTGIDALIPGRTTLYEAPTPPPSGGRKGSIPLAGRRLVVNWRFSW